MRIVALEEHFTVPELVRRVPPDRIRDRGFPPPDASWGPQSQVETLAELGFPRLLDMDAAGISVQVLSLAGLGADLLDAAEAPALARAFNDALARPSCCCCKCSERTASCSRSIPRSARTGRGETFWTGLRFPRRTLRRSRMVMRTGF